MTKNGKKKSKKYKKMSKKSKKVKEDASLYATRYLLAKPCSFEYLVLVVSVPDGNQSISFRDACFHKVYLT